MPRQIACYRAIAAEDLRAVGEMAAQLEAESDRQGQFLFIAALRSLAVHGEQLMREMDRALAGLQSPAPAKQRPHST